MLSFICDNLLISFIIVEDCSGIYHNYNMYIANGYIYNISYTLHTKYLESRKFYSLVCLLSEFYRFIQNVKSFGKNRI